MDCIHIIIADNLVIINLSVMAIQLPLALAQKLSSHFKIDFYQQVYGMQIEESDIEIKCQMTGKLLERPARTKSCKLCCVCEFSIL